MENFELTVEQNRRFYADKNSHQYKGQEVSTVVLDIARRYIRTGTFYLDVGAGDGALMKQFKKKYPSKFIEGLDIAPAADIVANGDCTDMGFYPGESLDGVFCTDVFEHLGREDLNKTISEISRILQCDGYLILSTMNKENLIERITNCPDCGKRFHPSGHCQVFDKERMSNLLIKHGLKIIKTKEIHLHFIAYFGWLAKLFYFLQLHRIKPIYMLTSDLFVIARKDNDTP